MPVSVASTRSARLGLRTTPEQETVLRRAAEVAHKSLTDFILDAAVLADIKLILIQQHLERDLDRQIIEQTESKRHRASANNLIRHDIITDMQRSRAK